MTQEEYEIASDIVGPEWAELIGEEFFKRYMLDLGNWIIEQRRYITIRPNNEDVFRAFKMTPPSQTKVVMLGQDPYPSYHADGLAFSSGAEECPASLKEILRDIEKTCYNGFDVNLLAQYSLESWAEQGVLLLNRSLTVQEGRPSSHHDIGWEMFNNVVMSQVNRLSHIVIILLGNYAKQVSHLLTNTTNLVLAAKHPAAAARNKEKWDSGGIFKECNDFLLFHNKPQIKWNSLET